MPVLGVSLRYLRHSTLISFPSFLLSSPTLLLTSSSTQPQRCAVDAAVLFSVHHWFNNFRVRKFQMRKGNVCFRAALPSTWAAEYLARYGAQQWPPLSTSPEICVPNPTPQVTVGKEDAGLSSILSFREAAALTNDFAAARSALLDDLGLCPFSYSSLTGQVTTSTEGNRLCGLTAEDFATSVSSASSSSGSKPATPQPQSSVVRDAAAAQRESSPPAHWPSRHQLTQETTRYIAVRRHLWEDTTTTTTSAVYAGTPVQLVSLPFTIVAMLAQHAVRHAWRGGPHVYPDATPPAPSQSFAFNRCPRLTPEDVTSAQWDRHEAAQLLLSALRHRSIQTDLRVRLWAAAQRYHRDILHDLAALSTSSDKDEDGGERVVELEGGGQSSVFAASGATTRVLLPVLQRELFTLPTDLYYTETSSGGHRGLKLRPLHSSHWFQYTSSDAALVSVLAERPHTSVFIPTQPFAQVSTMTGGGAPRAASSSSAPPTPSSHTTQARLWLLLSEMTRLRVVVAYFLQLERFLFRMRVTSSLPREVDRDVQTVQDAQLMEAVFAFLDLEPQRDLERMRHHRRFLLRYHLQHDTSADVAPPATPDTTTARCCATVQELFNAFTRALKSTA